MAISRLNFTQVPNIVFDQYLSELSPIAFKVFCAICRKTIGWHKETDRISNSQLMKMTGIRCNKALLRAVQQLISFDLIEVQRDGSGCAISTFYELKFDPVIGFKPTIEESNIGPEPIISEINIGREPSTKEIKDLNKKDLKDIVHQDQKAVDEHVDIFSDNFKRFWSAYPRKQGGKVAAFRKWKSQKCDLYIDEPEGILEDIAFRMKNVSPNGWLCPRTHKLQKQYIPLPTTYLNQHRWEDELA
jgi:phage replication O-like protein O